MDFENKPALYEQAKKALIKFEDCFSISSSSNIEGKPFSQFKREKSWIRHGKDRKRHVKTYGVVRKKINPSGADDKILKCLSCGSFRHLLDDCPDSWENIAKNMGTEHRNALCHSDRAVLDGPRVWKEPTNKSGVIEKLVKVVTSLKEEIISLKREIKQIKICRNRKLNELREYFKVQSEKEEEETCISSVLGKRRNEVKNSKNEVITLKDEIMNTMAAKDRELGKQVAGKIKNTSMPENNGNKSGEDEASSSEIKNESINGVLRTEMIDMKFNSYIQIKENCEEHTYKHHKIRKDIRKDTGIKEIGWVRKSK